MERPPWLVAELLLLLSLLCLQSKFVQTQTITDQTVPFNTGLCINSTQYWDTATLACASCPSPSYVAPDRRSCQLCDDSQGSFYTNDDGYQQRLNWLPAVLVSTAQCQCSNVSTGVVSTISSIESEGMKYQRCVQCPASSRVQNGVCLPEPTAYETTLTNEEAYNAARLLVASIGASIPAYSTTAKFPSGALDGTFDSSLSFSNSYPLFTMLGHVALACATEPSSRQACNALANICALQMFDFSQGSCRFYDAIVRRNNPNPVESGSLQGSTSPLPWMYYPDGSYLTDPNVNINYAFHGDSIDASLAPDQIQTVSKVQIVLSGYTLNGTWVGYTNFTKQFQLCGADKDEAANWINFGWAYRNACKVDLTDILDELPAGDRSTGTIFYDPFLQTGVNTLYPIPVKVNVPSSQNNPESTVRRFFFVDGSLGTGANIDNTPGVLQRVMYPSSILLQMTLLDSPRDHIVPPLLTITYDAQTVSSTPTSTRVSFEVQYNNNGHLNDQFWRAWRIMLIVFEVVIAFPLFLWKMLQFLRKRRGATDGADQDLIFFSVVAICDAGSFGLVLVLFFVTFYYLVLYKLQKAVYFMMVPDDDLYNFTVTVILAIVGQSVGLVWKIYEQTKLDVFLLDWEKPRKVMTREGGREETSPISAWRMLLVANEFSELQTKRITYPAFTLILLTTILVGAEVQSSGYISPWDRDYKVYNSGVTSIILRFGIEAIFFFVLGLGQYLLIRIFIHRYVKNPVTQLVDLAYLANVSIIILDDKNSGYYLHGRNLTPYSDTGIKELNDELLKESEGMISSRGFITNYQNNPRLNDNQVFLLFLEDSIRKQYEMTMLRQIESAAQEKRQRRGQITSWIRGPGNIAKSDSLSSQAEINATFKKMLADMERDHATQVMDPSYYQMLVRLPPNTAAGRSIMVHDYFNSWTNTMFWGMEFRLFVYEALFFCSVDMRIQNIPVTAIITYVVIVFFKLVRNRFGEDNLAKKTLVSPHFLV